MKKYEIICIYLTVGIIVVLGYYYIFQPGICNKHFCSGDMVLVKSENKTAILEIGEFDREYDMTNVHYDTPLITPNWPGREFYYQTKSFNDFELIKPNPETCIRIYYKRTECS